MDPFAQSSLSPSDFFNGLELTHQQHQQQQQHQHQHQQHQQQQHQQHQQHQQLQHSSSSSQHQQAVVQPGPRNYKSRKYRPCDFCRQRQVQCKIEVAPPCQLCSSHSRECTFVERPKKKRRPNASSGVEAGLRTIDPALTSDHGGAVHLNNGIDSGLANGFVPHYDEHLFQRMGHEQYIDPQISPHQSHPHIQPLGGLDHGGPHDYKSQEYSGRSSTISSILLERPLDSQTSRSARFIGETGESNPYLLRHYHYDENEECTVSKLTYRRIKKISQQQPDALTGDWGEPPVVFMLADDILAKKGEPRIEDDVLATARHDIQSMFTEEEALRLVGLFFRFVNPYFPILARSEMLAPNGKVAVEAFHAMPLSLISAIYATALPFMLYDDLLATTIVHNPPSAHDLYRISWLAVVNELHTPRHATLQTCLLLLQRAPTNRYTTDTPWKTSLVGWTVSLAQILGLHRACDDWATIPAWEISLRKRLWYGVYVMDKWASLGAGMPSHIQTADFDVLPLLAGNCELMGHDIEMVAAIGLPGPSEADSHFRLLSELTAILSDIMDAYYTLRASQQTSKDFSLSLELARPLRSRLKAWNDSLPPALSLHAPDRVDSRGMAKLSGNPSLSLAYIVATMTLFRALLRPLENLTSLEEEDHGIVGSRVAVRSGAKECAKEVVEFVENLGRGALDAFWHSWSRANFAIASSFLMQLLVTSETAAENAEINELVARWRWAMRIGSGSTGSGLMSLGLLRLDGLLLESSGGNGTGSQQQGGVGINGQRGSVGSS